MTLIRVEKMLNVGLFHFMTNTQENYTTTCLILRITITHFNISCHVQEIVHDESFLIFFLVCVLS